MILALTLLLMASSYAEKTVHFDMYTVDTGGVKMWVPSTLVVHEGDTVTIHAVSKIPKAEHGFEIEEFKVKEVVGEAGKDITFKASKEGVFPIKCHLHPAHLGGQLVVLED